MCFLSLSASIKEVANSLYNREYNLENFYKNTVHMNVRTISCASSNTLTDFSLLSDNLKGKKRNKYLK